MQTEQPKQTYRARAGLCELSSAHLKTHHGVTQLLLRGLDKVRCLALLAGLPAILVQHAASLPG